MDGFMSRKAKTIAATPFAIALLGGTILAGVPVAASAQDAPSAPDAAPAPADQQSDVIKTISVAGAQRLEPQTILSYIQMRPGQRYTAAAADQVLKDLAATELFADFSVTNNDGNVVINVVENPVINRVVLEGNKRLKDDKITPEIKLAPRQIFTRSKVRADVARIIELYKRQGRYAASVEPKMVQLSQNRVDVIFEITEGPKSKVRAINIIGNEVFSDSKLKGEMLTKEASLLKIFSSSTSYDPDRMAYDQQLLRQFYLTNGYAEFRVVSAVAELTPDKKNFIITYVVEEGPRYKFGDVKVESEIRDFDSSLMTKSLPMKEGEWYNAKLVEDTVDQLQETAGAYGYAFADVRPKPVPNRETHTMDVTFNIGEAQRTYVERIDVNGNTLTQDKVIRREFRLAEGDAFNSLAVKRTTNRINGLGYFQENFEVEQVDGSAPDRIVLEANVQEQATGQLSLSAGFSSLESFIFQGSIQQRNFRGRGQTVGLGVNWSRYSRSGNISFNEPHIFDRNISAGVDVYRRDYNNGYYKNSTATYKQSTTGAQFRLGVPLTEYTSVLGRYTINYDEITLDENQFYADLNGDGVRTCEPLLAGRYLCEAVGNRLSSILGLSLIYNTLDSYQRPTRGRSATASLDFAGLGGDTRYVRLTTNAAQYWPLGGGLVFSLTGEAGFIKGLTDKGPGVTDVLLNDRFFLGEPQLRGFDIRGVGPRVVRRYYLPDDDNDPTTPPPLTAINARGTGNDALGGTGYYRGRAELEIPLGAGARELGLRPSVFFDIGSVFGVKRPALTNSPYPNGIFLPSRDSNGNALYQQKVYDSAGTVTGIQVVTNATDPQGNANTPIGSSVPPFVEEFYGDSPKPRASIGIGVNWNSPFGPFRIDFAYPLLKQKGDDTKRFSFNVGTQF
ncbi:outer membrane protein assembly factor BamA [Croceibacterium aestuarii]|uniref:outer membrane protein assembly factor BamA n=1 Tax=Croceibacterium aestuarii TaxID=3064139 RepID=UPI003F6EBBFD